VGNGKGPCPLPNTNILKAIFFNSMKKQMER
jgi:hypothetical protein